MNAPIPYMGQRIRRGFEREWVRIEALIDRFATITWNPFYHFGTIAILLLIIITVTGGYITIFYRPGADRAFESVAGMTATPIGSLMRTVHRYASATLIFVTLLHAIKSFARDQVRGSRWLAWASGWLLLGLFWVIGMLGYWLVWDRTAQWITEWAMDFGSGQSVITFISPNLTAQTFMFFVIVLFLHIFLSVLILLWLLVHVIRISHVRIWAPRWLWVGSSVILSIFSVWRPAAAGLQADMSRQLGTIQLDHWYLGFLPLVNNIGNGWLWGISFGTLFVMVLVPWLLPGRKDLAAVVDPDLCNGDARCYNACPYGAIIMAVRDDDSGHERIARVEPDLCTACGLCVGVCPTTSIEIPDMPTSLVRDGFTGMLGEHVDEEKPLVAAFVCARHASLGGVPNSINTPVGVSEWSSGSDSPPIDVAVSTLACSGMLNARWIRGAVDGGADAVVTLTCPGDDCRFEQGPAELETRLNRGWLRRRDDVHRLEVSPGDRSLLRRLLGAIEQSKDGSAPGFKGVKYNRVRSGVVGVILLAILLLLPILAIRPTTAEYPADAGLRIAFVHGGEFLDVDFEEVVGGEIADSITQGQILGQERSPVILKVIIDGEIVVEKEYQPSGLRNEGKSSDVDTLWLGSGEFDVELLMNDNAQSWKRVFADRVIIDKHRVMTLLWSESLGMFEEQLG